MDKQIINTAEIMKDKCTWSKSIKNGDKRETIEVEELDGGGFLVTTDCSYKVGDEYKYDISKKYSETNPLEDKDFEENHNKEKEKSLFDYIESNGKTSI